MEKFYLILTDAVTQEKTSIHAFPSGINSKHK